MTPEQIAEWMGLAPGELDGVYGKWPEVCEAMKDLPVPSTDQQHIHTFGVFLRSAGRVPGRRFS